MVGKPRAFSRPLISISKEKPRTWKNTTAGKITVGDNVQYLGIVRSVEQGENDMIVVTFASGTLATYEKTEKVFAFSLD